MKTDGTPTLIAQRGKPEYVGCRTENTSTGKSATAAAGYAAFDVTAVYSEHKTIMTTDLTAESAFECGLSDNDLLAELVDLDLEWPLIV